MTGLAKQRLQQIKRKDFLEGAALVDGVWLPGLKRSAVIDPATNEEIGSAAHCQPADVEEAIDAAERAMSGWRALLPEERGAKLRSWAALMRSNSEDLAVIMTCEQGKGLMGSRFRAISVRVWVTYACSRSVSLPPSRPGIFRAQ